MKETAGPDEAAFLAVHGGGLVEEAAGAAGEGVLGLLADFGHGGLVLLDAVELGEGEDGAHFEGGGGGEAGAEGDVAQEHALPAVLRGGGVAVEEPVEGAVDVVLPGHLLGGGAGGGGELGGFHEVGGGELAGVVGRGAHGEEGAFVDGGGEDVAFVVVGVVAEDFDAAGGVGDNLGLLAVLGLELGDEFVVDFLILHGWTFRKGVRVVT